jgi:hypothetical protein
MPQDPAIMRTWGAAMLRPYIVQASRWVWIRSSTEFISGNYVSLENFS